MFRPSRENLNFSTYWSDKKHKFYFTEKTKIPEDVYVRIIGHCVGM